MSNRLIAVALMLLAACAGGDEFQEEPEIFEEDTFEEEPETLGTTAQALNFKGAPARQHGVQMNSPGAKGFRCDPTSTTQTCYFLKKATSYATNNPTFRVYINTSFTQAERDLLVNTFNSVGQEIKSSFSSHPQGWSFAATYSFQACPNPDGISSCTNASIRKVDLSMPTSGQPGYNHIASYGGLEEFQNCETGIKTDNMKGNFKACWQAIGAIDLANINARGANSTEDAQLLRHVVGNLWMQIIGFGNNADTSGTPSSLGHTAITPFSGRVPNSVGEVCRGNAFDMTGASNTPFIGMFEAKCSKN